VNIADLKKDKLIDPVSDNIDNDVKSVHLPHAVESGSGQDHASIDPPHESDANSDKAIDPSETKPHHAIDPVPADLNDDLQKRRVVSKTIKKTKKNAVVKNSPKPKYYWSFDLHKGEPALDLIHNQKADLENGAHVVVSHGKGSIVDTKTSENASINLGDFKGKCFSDPDTCKDKGLTVVTSLKLDQSTLSKASSSYIMSSGGQTTKARGFALVRINKQYVLILGTKNKQWMVKTPTLPSDWFKLAFTWHNDGDLKLYVDGKMVSSAKSTAVARPKDAFTALTMGRPNNSNTNKYRLGLEVDSVALWETELTYQQIADIMKSGVNIPKEESHPQPTKTN